MAEAASTPGALRNAANGNNLEQLSHIGSNRSELDRAPSPSPSPSPVPSPRALDVDSLVDKMEVELAPRMPLPVPERKYPDDSSSAIDDELRPHSPFAAAAAAAATAAVTTVAWGDKLLDLPPKPQQEIGTPAAEEAISTFLPTKEAEKPKKKKKGVGFAVVEDGERQPLTSEALRGPDGNGVAAAATATAAVTAVTTASAESSADQALLGQKKVAKKKKGVGFASSISTEEVAEDVSSSKIKKGVGFADAAEIPREECADTFSNRNIRNVRVVTDISASDLDAVEEATTRAAATPMAVASDKVLKPVIASAISELEGPSNERTFLSVHNRTNSVEEVGHAESSPSVPLAAGESVSRFTFDVVLDRRSVTVAASASASVAVATDLRKSKIEFDFIDDQLGLIEPKAKADKFKNEDSLNSTADRKDEEGLSPQETAYIVSAAQFRRIERANRRYSIASDVWCGIEEARHARQDAAWLAGSLGLMPLLTSIICYSSWTLNFDESADNKARWSLTLALTFVVLAVLLVEAFSSLIFEVEFGVVVAEEIPALYIYSAFWGVCMSVIVQQILYATHAPFFSYGEGADSLAPPRHRAWMWQLLAGFIGCAAPVVRAFYAHAPSMLNAEMRRVFLNWLGGCCTALLVLPVFYIVYATVFSAYGHEGGGVVGVLLALLFPAIRIALKALVCAAFQWGEGRARLYSGSTLDVLVDTMHSAFFCLLVSSTSCSPAFITLVLVSQTVCYAAQVLQLLSYSDSTCPAVFDPRKVFTKGCCFCPADSRIGVKESPVSSPNKHKAVDIEDADETHRERGYCDSSSISAESMEGYSFETQNSKLRQIMSLLCSVVLGAFGSTVLVLFTLVASATRNAAQFEGMTAMWELHASEFDYGKVEAEGESRISGEMQRLLVLTGYQWLACIFVMHVLQSRGNAVGVILTQLMFHYKYLLAAASSFAALVVVGSVCRGDGVNAEF